MNLRESLQLLRNQQTEEQALTTPILWMGLITGLGYLVYGLLQPQWSVRIYCLAAGFLNIGYILLYFRYLLPLIVRNGFARWTLFGFNIIVVTLLLNSDPPSTNKLSLVLAGLLVMNLAILYGRVEAYVAILLVTVGRIMFILQQGISLPWPAMMEKLIIPVLGILCTEIILGYKRILRQQVHRLETINEVTRSVSSSLEIEEVIHLVNKTIPAALPADTYFVALKRGDKWCLELFFDDGIFFPPECMDMDEQFFSTLSGWVAENRQPLLIRNLEKEIHHYRPQVIVRGSPNISKSWMGVPLESSGRLLGGISVASYHAHAFQKADLVMLQNIGQHVAMAIENAYHHAEVEQQARLDSLTGALNHNTFLSDLEVAVETSLKANQLISLIMLDIDHFKEYNDTYGHVVGDKVLIQITKSIRQHIKGSDLVGRWGGEEFAIALPNASGRQAAQVANRIRQTLSNLQIISRDGTLVPAPTASQGIAVLPIDSSDFMSLVDLADQRLYRAKKNGRDQVEPDCTYWDQPALFSTQKASLPSDCDSVR